MKHVCHFLKTGSFRYLCLISMMLFASSFIQAQTTVSGKVTGKNGTPLQGISVSIRNTGAGTTTDASGVYSLTANLKPGTYTIEFSGVGLKPIEKKLSLSGGAVSLDATLTEEALGLDEVVVTGNRVATRKKELAYQVTTLTNKNVTNTGTQNLLGAVQGKVPGAVVNQNTGDPAGGFSLRLRGIASFNGSAEPLYIIDGVVMNNSSSNVINLNADGQATGLQGGQNRLVDINPNDIERMEVINGAAAAALYGPLAANGVVQIFTKKGSSGKPKITFSTSFQINSLLRRLDFNTTPQRFGIPSDATYSQFADRLTTISNSRSNQATVPGTGPVSLGGRLDKVTYPVTRYDYQDDIFGTTFGTDNYLNMSGGNDKTTYSISGSFLTNDGIVLPTNFTRYGLKVRVDQKINAKLKASGGVNYVNSRSRDLPNGNNFFSPISIMFINDNVWDADRRGANNSLQHMEFNRMNVRTPRETFDIRQSTNRIVGDIQLNYNPIEGLNLTYSAGVDNYSLVGNTYQPRVAYFFNPTVPTTQQVAASAFPDGYVAIGRENFTGLNQDFVATYVREFLNGDLKSTTTGGYSYNYQELQRYTREGRDLQAFGQNITAARNFFTPETEFRGKQNISGFFLQQGFGYKRMLFLTGAIRRDQSSAFSPDAIGTVLPRVTFAFLPSELDGFKNSNMGNWFNTLKFRAAYGKAFLFSAVQYFDRFTTYTPFSYVGGLGGFTTPLSLNDRNILPETKNEIEVGTDMEFFKGRLNVTLNYYSQKIENLIVRVLPAPSVGGTSILSNVGTMTNKGIELLISGAIIKNKNFQWVSTINYNRNRNKVTKVTLAPGFINLNAETQGIQQGYPFGIFNIRYYARNADGSLLLNADGLPQVERGDASGKPQRDANGQPLGTPLRKIFGTALPDWTATFINEFAYKNLSLRIQVDHNQGGLRYNWNRVTGNNVGNGLMAQKELRGELPRGWVAAVGGFIGPRIQEEHLESGTFTRLRELTLSYNIGKVGKVGNLTVGVTGRNLFLWTDYTGYDPETNSGGQSTRVLGDDFGNFPIPRTILFNLTVNF